MWIARDSDGSLWAYSARPFRKRGMFDLPEEYLGMQGIDLIDINKDEFPEVTWKNSPKEITTTIKTKK